MSDNKYDLVPYSSHPYEQTTPEHLATVAKLFGMEAADYATARVLEIGCASGGNIIPLAALYPESQFHGVDLSTAEIGEGCALTDELGLTNINLEVMSLADIGKEFGTFDYIIAHGVYSWVDEPLRKKLLEICKNNLSEKGLAFVSYNTLPGWNMIRSIREMMVYHTKDLPDPAQKITQARAILQFMTDAMEGDESPYAQVLKNEMNMLKNHGDYYLFHDHMEDTNHPVYFHEFMGDAREVGLEYLADAEVETMLLDNLPPGVAEKLRAAKEIVHIEQYMDFFRNRRFRNTILFHQGIGLQRNITNEKIEEFHLVSLAEPKEEITEDKMAEGVNLRFASPHTRLDATDKLSKLTMKILWEQSGRPLAYSDLVDKVLEASGGDDREAVSRHLMYHLNLINLVFKRLIRLRLSPGFGNDAVSEKPDVFPVARYQARKGPIVTTMRHQNLQISAVEQLIMQYMDGTRTVDEIAKQMHEHHRAKQIQVNVEGETEMSEEAVFQHLKSVCLQVLDKYRQLALIK